MRKCASYGSICLLASLFLLAPVINGCGGGTTPPECDGVANPCAAADVQRCNPAGDAAQICQADADGCLVWTNSASCGTHQSCEVSGSSAACACDDECTTSGATQCSGTVIQTCTADADECLYLEAGTDCADSSQNCDDSAEPAVCTDICTNECDTVGATQCNLTVIETCTVDGDGCNDWVAGTDCADNSEYCDDSTEPAACTATCTSDCVTLGATQCADTVIETCTQIGACTNWVAGTDCADSNQFCDNTADPAVCVDTCTNECPTVGL
ncbi:MAG: hypothetical protein JRJ19_10400, partial [Deltaproteobacteria bacterium]|nr:hypothetical protein [Deltaproteobacteria bacterium]